jgi:hypothetical protein
MGKRKARRFKTTGDTGISVYVTGRPDPLRLEATGTYTTDDPAEIDALQGTPEVTEVKIPERKNNG